jgi:uncharacterized cupin superfamily protein
MSSLTLTPAAQVTGALTAAGQRPGADSGDPQLHVRTVAPDTPGSVGVWECQPGGWPIVDRADTEVCYVLSGAATITDDATIHHWADGAVSWAAFDAAVVSSLPQQVGRPGSRLTICTHTGREGPARAPRSDRPHLRQR